MSERWRELQISRAEHHPSYFRQCGTCMSESNKCVHRVSQDRKSDHRIFKDNNKNLQGRLCHYLDQPF